MVASIINGNKTTVANFIIHEVFRAFTQVSIAARIPKIVTNLGHPSVHSGEVIILLATKFLMLVGYCKILPAFYNCIVKFIKTIVIVSATKNRTLIDKIFQSSFTKLRRGEPNMDIIFRAVSTCL